MGPQRVRKCVDARSILFGAPRVALTRRQPEEEEMEAYCLKCRTKREMKSPKPITMKNGKPATEGTCPTCGTRMFKIGKA